MTYRRRTGLTLRATCSNLHLCALSEIERDLISQRTKEALSEHGKRWRNKIFFDLAPPYDDIFNPIRSKNFVQDFTLYIRTRDKVSRKQRIPQLRTIPILKGIEHNFETLPYERAEELVKSQEKFAVAPCICRREKKLMGKGCDAPQETCLMFGEWADYYARNSLGRYIEQTEVMDILTKADEANLVLQPSNSKDIALMCCCCGCCCAVLTRIKPHPKTLTSSISL